MSKKQPVNMADYSPPKPPPPSPGDPKLGSLKTAKSLYSNFANTKSIAGAALLYSGECDGDDNTAYKNNCAHFLSDAFIRAGYTELSPPSDCINARCGTEAKRPIRARNMWCWFKEMAIETYSPEPTNSLPEAEGLWAVFQLNLDEYWGGHVLIYDSDNNVYYGTGHYPDWDQYLYKW